MRRYATLLPLLVCTSLLSAQKTWIVDARGGLGSHFSDLPQAVQKAKDGDILLMRPGRYSGVTIASKGLSILGGNGVSIQPAVNKAPFTITNLPKTSKMVLRGLRFEEWAYRAKATLQISSCRGIVLVEECVVLEPHLAFGPAVSISSSSSVVFNHSAVRQGLKSVGSDLVFNGSLSYYKPKGFGFPGIITEGGSLELNQATIVPGFHRPHTSNVLPYGVEAKNSTILVRGDSFSDIFGGFDQVTRKKLPAFFDHGGSRLFLDPDVTYEGKLTSFGNRVIRRQMPSLMARSGSLGGMIQGELYPPAGSAFVILVALPMNKISTPWGDSWLDPRSTLPLSVGSVTTRVRKSYSLPLPKLSQLLGLNLAFQAFSSNQRGFQLSNAGVTAIHN